MNTHPQAASGRAAGTPRPSSREDPHAQARAARAQPLLLHSLTLFREIFELLFAHHRIATVVEVGVESGQVSGMYADLGAEAVYCIDPQPSDQLRAILTRDDRLHLVEQRSPAALDEVPTAELYVIDGDHNYATVRAELEWVLTHAPDAVVVLHDVLWPCGRRDQYYQPSGLKGDQRQPDSDEGPTVWHDDLTPAGFVGLGAFTAAAHAGGERNGVLTAVEDALAEHGEWRFTLIPAVFGLGILSREARPEAHEITRSLRALTESRLLAALENNRIALYTRVLQLQYEAVQHLHDADSMAERIQIQQQRIEQLEHQLDKAEQRHTADLTALHDAHERLADHATYRPSKAALSEAAGLVNDLATRHVAESLARLRKGVTR